MSVIVTDMDMPKCCRDCDYECINDIFVSDIILKSEYIHKRHEDCPLKSVEGLIEKIKEYWIQCDDLLQAPTLRGIRKIIKEYCEVEE